MLKINNQIESIEQVSVNTHNVSRINSIEVRYKGERQESKAPTFRSYLWRSVLHSYAELWFLRRESQIS